MSSLQKKLYNYEQVPPERVWDKITAALDESHLTEEFPSKVYNTEITPPANTWNKIATALDAEQPSVPSITRRRVAFFRYAAAAVLIGLISFGVIKWMNGNNSSSGNGVANNSDTAGKNNKPDISTTEIAQPAQPDQQNSVAAVIPEEKTRVAKKQRNNYSASDDTETTEPIYAYNEHTPNLADRYIMLMTPDGGIIRVSKKWENLVCCVSGQEQDPDCKDQLRKWQEKLACSPVATSNFLDIFSLVNTLNTTEL